MIDYIYKLAVRFEKLAVAEFPPLMAEEIFNWAKNKYFLSLKRIGKDEFNHVFDINLDYLSRPVNAELFDSIPVKLTINEIFDNKIGGTFNPETFSINITISKNIDIDIMLDMLDTIIEHELAHMLQFIVMKNNKNKVYEESRDVIDDFDLWYKNYVFHGASNEDNILFLRSVELQPHLLSAVKIFINNVHSSKLNEYPNSARITVPITIDDFNTFVGNPKPITTGKLTTYPLFEKLHNYDFPRWKKAVKEFWKLVEVYIDKE